MACACKVNKNIQDIQKQYGTNNSGVKTNIRGLVSVFFKKILIAILIIPVFPLFLIYLIIRKFITNKPISITRFIKLKKNVRS